mgnify:CR=1 FL=1
MEENTILTIVVAVAGIVILVVAGYQIARLLRGTIKLLMPQTAFDPGTALTGSFELKTRKAIEGKKLIVSLIGYEIIESRRDGKTETRQQEVYRNEKIIEDARAYQAGYNKLYDFEIPAPKSSSPEFLNTDLGKTLATAASLLTNRRSRMKWKLEARLVAKGIDLFGSKKISINPE